jgi:hypothetical protein
VAHIEAMYAPTANGGVTFLKKKEAIVVDLNCRGEYW